ncbi:MAG: hypothetical protein K8H88_15580, partial [Sandaracinaceae bacterium]|nr:hypothetical protein [Sandaracinaceae bacterium]
GGCTTDACLPDPCTAPPFTLCVAGPSGASCECPAGTHREGAACAPDESCVADSCAGHGACEAIDGRVQCACDAGYAGARCEDCESGYHDDGMGACTMDPCLPNPCMEPNRSVCAGSPSGASCECDAGYHDDGVGGCTTDPCLPHPCGMQACRAGAGGAAECYTPVCDDRNPCTMDTPGPSGCTYAPLANGTACSSTACRTGQTCMAGACTGGSAVDCADTNPCTADTCDAIVGCQHTTSTTLIPDDGLACTVDSCATGVATHTASDAACDDGLFCTGAERCAPEDASRDARGCVRGAAPVAPGPSTPCAYYGACSEATQSFPLVTRSAGASCDDG